MMNANEAQERRFQHPYWLWEAMNRSYEVLQANLADSESEKIECVVRKIVEIDPKHIFLLGTGSSGFAGMITAHALNELTDIPASVYNTSEFGAYPPSFLGPDTVVIATSHSGETPGDIPVMELIHKKGAFLIGITNYPESSLAKAVDLPLIGPNTPVLRLRLTRSYNGNILRGLQIAVSLGKKIGHKDKAEALEEELMKSPLVLRECLEKYALITPDIAKSLLDVPLFFMAAAGPNMSTAYEAALGFYQGSGARARALQIEEFLHGSIQAMREEMCLVAIAAPGPLQNRILRSVNAVQQFGAKVVLIGPKSKIEAFNPDVAIPMSDDLPELLTPVIYTAPLWQIGYHFSLLTGRDPDYMEMSESGHKKALASLMPEGSQFDRWAGRID